MLQGRLICYRADSFAKGPWSGVEEVNGHGPISALRSLLLARCKTQEPHEPLYGPCTAAFMALWYWPRGTVLIPSVACKFLIDNPRRRPGGGRVDWREREGGREPLGGAENTPPKIKGEKEEKIGKNSNLY